MHRFATLTQIISKIVRGPKQLKATTERDQMKKKPIKIRRKIKFSPIKKWCQITHFSVTWTTFIKSGIDWEKVLWCTTESSMRWIKWKIIPSKPTKNKNFQYPTKSSWKWLQITLFYHFEPFLSWNQCEIDILLKVFN